MNSFFFLFRKYALDKVFTPSTVAKLNYVQRTTLEKDVDKFLDIPGMQIVLYGYSGCGKSTLIYNKLVNHKISYIITSCSTNTSFNDLLFQAFDKLNIFYLSEKSNTKKLSIKSDIKANYETISSSISQTLSNERTNKSVRVLPVQLTPERLAEFLGAVGCVWVIEDFDKVSDVEKKKIADVMKIFMDSAKDFPKVKIICIGAVGTARELIELNSNLSTRVAEISVPLFKDDELEQIVKTGFKLMNIRYESFIKDKIIYYSNSLASICHQICYDICFSRKLLKRSIFPVTIEDTDLKQSVNQRRPIIYKQVEQNKNNINLKKEMSNLQLSDSDNGVKISIDCFNGTIASVSFKNERIVTLHCAETKVIGKASQLKGKTIKFHGAANNPGGNKIKITHKIFEVGGKQIAYTFPDDYIGDSPYDNKNDNPSYTFFVNFL